MSPIETESTKLELCDKIEHFQEKDFTVEGTPTKLKIGMRNFLLILLGQKNLEFNNKFVLPLKQLAPFYVDKEYSTRSVYYHIKGENIIGYFTGAKAHHLLYDISITTS